LANKIRRAESRWQFKTAIRYPLQATRCLQAEDEEDGAEKDARNYDGFGSHG